MAVKDLSILNLRNIEKADLQLSDTLNVFVGDNGSGKTSILEAVYFLSTASSFRTVKLNRLIREGSKEAIVRGTTQGASGQHQIGIARSQARKVIKIDGQEEKRRSVLARLSPVIALTPTSIELLEGGPKYRRRFLDWGVFHVEQEYSQIWNRFQRALKQRNAFLSQQTPGSGSFDQYLPVLDRAFVDLAKKVETMRASYLQELKPLLDFYLKSLALEQAFSFHYYPGYADALGLEQALQGSLERDRKNKRTEVGPHRADLQIKLANVDARELLSRGQAKMLVYALILAQVSLLKKKRNIDAVLLLDDVASELDEFRLTRLLKLLEENFTQVLLTAISKDLLPEHVFCETTRLFHVEQGQVSLH